MPGFSVCPPSPLLGPGAPERPGTGAQMQKEPVPTGACGTTRWGPGCARGGGTLCLSERSDRPPARGRSGGSAWVASHGNHSWVAARRPAPSPHTPGCFSSDCDQAPECERRDDDFYLKAAERRPRGSERDLGVTLDAEQPKSLNICLDSSDETGLPPRGTPLLRLF